MNKDIVVFLVIIYIVILYTFAHQKTPLLIMKTLFYTLLIVSASFILTSCNETSSGLTYFNDFENMHPWISDSTLKKGLAHSGSYAIKAASPWEFGIGLKLKFSDISYKPLKKIKISAWINLTDTIADAVLVTGINAPDKPNVFYETKVLNRIIREKDKWVEIEAEYFINKESLNKPENTILVYVWNKSKQAVLMDDLKVSFEEQ